MRPPMLFASWSRYACLLQCQVERLQLAPCAAFIVLHCWHTATGLVQGSTVEVQEPITGSQHTLPTLLRAPTATSLAHAAPTALNERCQGLALMLLRRHIITLARALIGWARRTAGMQARSKAASGSCSWQQRRATLRRQRTTCARCDSLPEFVARPTLARHLTVRTHRAKLSRCMP